MICFNPPSTSLIKESDNVEVIALYDQDGPPPSRP